VQIFFIKPIAWEQAAHHIVFFTLCFLNVWYERWCLCYWVLTFGELSTIFLDIRWMMVGSGVIGNIGPVNILFALSFFITRSVMYGWLIYLVLTEDPNAFQDWSIWQICPVFLVAGFGLNTYWMKTIANSVLSGARKKADVPSTEKDK
jgi:hypothetical protein